MMSNDNILTPHPLRTIILRYNKSIAAPAFETAALAHYFEIHDRVLEIRQRIQGARSEIAPFEYHMEEIQELLEQAQEKFRHLEMMLPRHPEKSTVRTQLKTFLTAIDKALDDFVPELVGATADYYDYDDYIFQQEEWIQKVAFPQFDQIFKNYKDCSVDMVSFDRDLEDFKMALGFVKRQETKYYETMDRLIDSYSELNTEIGDLFSQVESFDNKLLL